MSDPGTDLRNIEAQIRDAPWSAELGDFAVSAQEVTALIVELRALREALADIASGELGINVSRKLAQKMLARVTDGEQP